MAIDFCVWSLFSRSHLSHRFFAALIFYKLCKFSELFSREIMDVTCSIFKKGVETFQHRKEISCVQILK